MAQLLGLDGDPYLALLSLEGASSTELIDQLRSSRSLLGIYIDSNSAEKVK